MILLKDGHVFAESKFALEADFEKMIVAAQTQIFGKDAIYIDAKKKIGSGNLGSAIPDGFLFDMSDPENQEFYLVEAELESHSFYNHIFPQITKFFAFYKNSQRQKELVEKLFNIITTDNTLKRQFKKYLGEQEIHKFLSDVIDSSQNILLIIDGDKPELPEITDTYSDTWGKMVKVLTVKKYTWQKESILMVHPEFESIEFSFEETPIETEQKHTTYSEEFHLEGVAENVKDVYQHLKIQLETIAPSFILNPQKYYISIKGTKNIAFLKVRKTKIRMVVMVAEDQLREQIQHHSIKSLSASVQKFYNGPCAAVDIHDLQNIEEIVTLLHGIVKLLSTEEEVVK